MAKSLEFDEDARRALERGVNRLADAGVIGMPDSKGRYTVPKTPAVGPGES